MRRNERGWVLLCYRGRERYIQQRRWRAGKEARKGKDEIIVEMSEM